MSVDRITADDKGVYLIATQGSTHLWNLDEGWYIRNPDRVGETNNELLRGFDGFNGTPLPLDDVVQWPEVGSAFLLRLPAPYNFHRSSAIKSIEEVS